MPLDADDSTFYTNDAGLYEDITALSAMFDTMLEKYPAIEMFAIRLTDGSTLVRNRASAALSRQTEN